MEEKVAITICHIDGWNKGKINRNLSYVVLSIVVKA